MTIPILPLSLALLIPLASGSAPAGPKPYLVVLGIAQDAGYPQAGQTDHPGWDDPSQRRLVSCLALVDPVTSERWLFDATPDFPEQLLRLDRMAPVEARAPGLAGIFLTHAHIGHYTGLMHLGREVLGTHHLPVYAMPRMAAFLRGNGPWDQLVRLENIDIRPLADGRAVRLNDRLTVTPIQVPHRDEYSETVGYRIDGPERSALFIPDIDKWTRWDEQGGRLEDQLAKVDIAYLDASFFADGEVPGRDMAQIPHPFVSETIARLAPLPAEERAKVRFIHLNRTNPALRPDSAERRAVEEAGHMVAEELEKVDL